jgi:hypothetical protein
VSTRPSANDITKPTRNRHRERSGEGAVATASPAENTRLSLIGVKVDLALRREIDDYAKAHGITRSRAAGEYLTTARDALRERDGIPAGRAEELLEAFEGIRAVLELLGPPTFGILRLLAYWAAQGGAVKVTEDELIAELRAVGADEWEQAVADTERELQQGRRDGPQERS